MKKITRNREMETIIPVVENTTRFDLLDRQGFVDQLVTIANTLSENKKNACYAVNGCWGVGKSFVLDMFEEQTVKIGVEGQVLPRYLIFRYNCWEYDYYDEPLIAIVAAILDQLDEKENLLPADLKTGIIAALKSIGRGLVKKAVQLVEEKTGVDLKEAAEIIKGGIDTAEEDIQEAHKYDHYFDFKKNLKELQKTIRLLSKEQTVLFVVDELDRCLPEYTIKVLERLHHLFEGVDNVQVILSLDLGQLEHAVRQIYGEQADAKKYLRKFIQFELKLDEGIIKDHFEERFKRYTERFEIQSPTTSAIDVDEFKSYILNGIDMRSRISIINRCELIHNLLVPEDKVDVSYMCMEMLLVLLNECGIDTHHAKSYFNISSVFEKSNLFPDGEGIVPKGLAILSNRLRNNQVSATNRQELFESEMVGSQRRNYINARCLFGKILGAYRTIIGFDDDSYVYTDYQDDINLFANYSKKFWDFLQIVH